MMSYKKYRGNQLFTGSQLLSGNNVLIINERNIVEGIVPVEAAGDDIQYFEGIIMPGMINCHCHLELSHMQGIIPQQTGLVPFLISVMQQRNFSAEVIHEAMMNAEQEMYQAGIVAVGDIGNTTQSIGVKQQSKIRWHNFIEVINTTDEKIPERLPYFEHILQQYNSTDFPYATAVSLVPHAPYSISPQTFRLLNDLTETQVISIHNQESVAEAELYQSGTGAFLELYKTLGLDKSPLPVYGKNSLQTYLPYFNKQQTMLLVHNTYSSEGDIKFANQYAANSSIQLYYCLCPNANVYIENSLPPVTALTNQCCNIVLGTDSYSSNTQLNIAKEIATLHVNFPHIPLKNILQWATLNGAQALRMADTLGSFEKGKLPGVVLLNNDFESKRLL